MPVRPLDQAKVYEFAEQGVNYLVMEKPQSIPALELVYHTKKFYVYNIH